MKYKFRESNHKEYVGDVRGDLYLNKRKYFQFHSYPGEQLHKLWAVVTMLVLLFKIDDLFHFSVFSGLFGLYVFYVALFSHFLLIKKICRYKGYFLYPNTFVNYFKKRKKDVHVY